MNKLTPSIVEALINYKKGCDKAANSAKVRGDRIDQRIKRRGGIGEGVNAFDRERLQEYWYHAAMMMHISIAIAEYITKNAQPVSHIITSEDVGKGFIKIGSKTYILSDSIGRVTIRDVGRKLYVVHGLIYMEAL